MIADLSHQTDLRCLPGDGHSMPLLQTKNCVPLRWTTGMRTGRTVAVIEHVLNFNSLSDGRWIFGGVASGASPDHSVRRQAAFALKAAGNDR